MLTFKRERAMEIGGKLDAASGEIVPAGVEAWLSTRLVEDIRIPPGRRRYGVDHGEDTFEEDLVVDLSGLALHFTYVDASGAPSERTIRCSRLSQGTAGMLLVGFCLLRQAHRAFRLDRIREVYDLRTGEILDPEAYFAGLGLGAIGRHGVYLARARAGITVLMALAAADGHVHADEIEVAMRWADHLADLHGLRLEASLAEAVSRFARGSRPNAAAAISALRSAARSSGEASLLARHMRQMIDADGILEHEEVEMFEILQHAATRQVARFGKME